jgi:hypothetical protein
MVLLFLAYSYYALLLFLLVRLLFLSFSRQSRHYIAA